MKRLALLLAVAACSKEPPTVTAIPAEAAAPAVPATASAPAASSVPSAQAPVAAAPAVPSPSSASSTTRLLDAGQAPRRRFRYAWRAEQREELVLDLRTGASTDIAGEKQPEIPLPPVRITVDVDGARVSPDGTLSYAWVVRSAIVTGEGRTPAQIADGMRAEVAAIAHLAGHGAVSARGLCQEVTLDPSTTTDAGTTGEMAEQVRQTLHDITVPWPEEEIGRGARWQRVSELDAKGSRLTQTDTFTLVDAQGNTGTVDDVLAQTAPPQVLRTPASPSGSGARMESMLASGNSRTLFALTRLVPQTHFDGTTTMVLSGPATDTVRRMTMVMHLGMDIAGSLR